MEEWRRRSEISGAIVAPASLKQRQGQAAQLVEVEISGAIVAPASLKPGGRNPLRIVPSYFRGDCCPGLIEARGPGPGCC